MEKNIKSFKKDIVIDALPYFAVLWLVISLVISLVQQDLRWIGSGMFCFGVFYFGTMTVLAIKKFDSKIWILDKYSNVVFIVVLGIFSLLISLYGTALFLHHYDIDGLIDLYVRFGHWIQKYLP